MPRPKVGLTILEQRINSQQLEIEQLKVKYNNLCEIITILQKQIEELHSKEDTILDTDL